MKNFRDYYGRILLSKIPSKKTIRVMKLTLFLSILTISQLWATETYSQMTKLTLKLEDVKISDALKEIENQSEFFFLYSPKLIDVERKVDIDAKKEPIKDILSNIFGEKVKFAVYDRQVILTPSDLTIPSAAMQQLKITGIITEKDGTPISGVNVVVTGTTQGTMSDIAGKYSIEVPQGAKSLTFSFIGMETQEIIIGTLTQINVIMVESAIGLEEIIVVGYGTQRRKDLTGAISSVSAEDLKKTPIASLEQGLRGQAAGIQITQNSAQPGGVSTVRIRGGNSITAGNEPLYVIDGMLISEGGGASSPKGAPISPLSIINPNDVASVQILKDASATAIYGARGANGVIIITTKRGEYGKSNVSFEYYYGVQSIAKKIDLLNARQFAELMNEAFVNDGKTPLPFPDVENLANDIDWQKEIFRPAPIQNYQLSFSKGDEKSRFLISGNYFNQQGILINSGFKRYSYRINFDRNFSKKFRIGNSLLISNTNSNIGSSNEAGAASGLGGSAIHQALIAPPTSSMFKTDNLTYTEILVGTTGLPNPVSTVMLTTNQDIRWRILGNFFGEYDILEGLTAKVSIGIDGNNSKLNYYASSGTGYAYGSGGIAEVNTVLTTSWLNENTLQYKHLFNNVHFLDLLGGVTFEENKSESVGANAQGFVNDNLTYNNLNAAALKNVSSGGSSWGIISYLARANYNFSSKYYLTASARLDGSSRLGKDNRYAFFPSTSLAWRISEEGFMENLNFIDDLKIRLGYGYTGNQNVGAFASLATMGNNTVVFGPAASPQTGFYPGNLENKNLKWEKTQQYDAGLDLVMFKGRVSFNTDVYYKKTNDLLLSVILPNTSGFGTSTQNVGSLENRGIEFTLNTENLRGKFEWSTSFNISFNKNEVLALAEGENEILGLGGPGANADLKIAPSILRVGEPLNSFYGYIFDGVFQVGEDVSAQPGFKAGDPKFRDISGPDGTPDGIVNAYDRTIIGNANPDFTGGLTNVFRYKNIELSIFLQFVLGNEIYNLGRIQMDGLGMDFKNNRVEMLNRWTPENPSNTIPRATTSAPTTYRQSNQWIEDGSYLRARNISLAYNFPSERTKLKFVTNARIYISVQNLFTITNYSGYDPEAGAYGASLLSQGYDLGAYPLARTIMAGINLGF
jgi:TonB-linked SusC/RagA family outer membrane protein